MPITKLTELLKTDQNGTTFFHIKCALKELGVDTRAYSLTQIEELQNFSLPILIQVKQNHFFHFMVIYKIDKSSYIVMDPAYGKRKIKKEELESIWTGKIMIFHCQDRLPVIKKQDYFKKEIFQVIKKNQKSIWIIFILSILFTIFTYFCSFYLEWLIEKMEYLSISYFFYFLMIFIGIAFSKNIINYIRSKILIHLTQKIEFFITTQTFHKILSFPYTYYKKKSTGEWISRINDLMHVKNFIAKFILTVSLDVLLIIIGAILLCSINVYLFLICLVTIFLYYVILMVFKEKLKRMTEKNLENGALISNQMIEAISSIESIKNGNVSKQIENQFHQSYQNSLKDTFRYHSISNLETLCYEFLYQVSGMVILTVGILFVKNHTLTLPSLITYHMIFTYFLEIFFGLFDLEKEYHLARKSYTRANALYDIESEDLKLETNHFFIDNVSIQNLSFAHQKEDFILKNIDLEIKEKRKVMLVGRSGSGKSTLLKILYKYYPIFSGNVWINGINFNQIPILDIRKQISYLSQNEFIYTDTIYQNIILYRDISKEEFEKVCHITCVDEIIKDNPFGYDFLLEDNGSNISGGQRARVLLARALLKKSSMIMIDEGFSELDISLERKILKNIFTYYQEKIILVVSHRYNNMDLFDQVIHLDEKIALEKSR